MSVFNFYNKYNRVVVIDASYTTWEGALERGWSGEDEHREIFQVSAVKIDLVQDRIFDVFNRYVYPRKNPLLSDFALSLTHTTQEEVDHGVDFTEMYTALIDWSVGLSICSYERDLGPEGEGEVFKENIDLYGLDLPYDAYQFQNIVPLFSEAGIDVKNIPGGELYKCFEIELPGQTHEATHDAQSIACSLIALKEEYVILHPPPRS